MDEGDIEYIISELMLTTHAIALLENDIEVMVDNGESIEIMDNITANLQLQYIIRQQVIDKLMGGR